MTPETRQPDVIEGEVLAQRDLPRSPLDPDEHGVWPTALRPVPMTEPMGAAAMSAPLDILPCPDCQADRAISLPRGPRGRLRCPICDHEWVQAPRWRDALGRVVATTLLAVDGRKRGRR